MKVGDLVRISPKFSGGKWANAVAIILSIETTVTVVNEVDFMTVVCLGEIFETPHWTLEVVNETR